MKVTVCELPDDRKAFESAWEELVAYIRKQQSDLVLLPELPFSSWFARTPQFDAQIWQRAQEGHDVMMNRLSELAPTIVLGTHLVIEEERHLNRGFCWTPTEGYKGVHDKYYFPNEEDFYERCWFDRNRRDFALAHVQDLTIGFLICTEVMFNEWARYYGRQGANIIAVPRASSLDYERWVVAPRMAAIASGAFVISSNRVDDHLFGGLGLVIGPNGDVLASTSRQTPFVTVDIDLTESAEAKKTYPRDVLE
ncbi:MAG: carbon-nitrogen hydrolase family protein [Chloroflexi bacterium]|nr:carbon-nitrogen hydrolase family protein [Chloroflexota bacterium]